ncbi:hypothetical protein CRENBAI_021116 [Crenichthys baileyi]|uniref:Secreted protein n=1 Tax=Crenichthys baileyi TaxID=28760 RepID=A0AAV9RQ97_9TELE
MCQTISSHPSLFLIVFLLVCTDELVYLQEVTFHQHKGCDFSLAVFPQFHSSATQSIQSVIFAKIYYLYLLSGQILCFFSLFSGSVFFFFWIPFWFFPSHVSFLCLILECSQREQHQRTESRSQPAFESLPAHVCLFVPAAATRAASPYRPPP